MKARPYFLPAGTEKPKTRQNQFGGTVGGPIVQNTAFFFGSYESTDDEQVATRFGTVPTAAMRRGDFSASPTPIYDPLTGAADGSGRTAFAGQHHSGEPARSDRAEADRGPAAADQRQSSDRQLLRDRAVHVRPPQGRRQGQRQPDVEADVLRPPRLDEPQLRQPADVRRPRRSAGQRSVRQDRASALGNTMYDHRKRARISRRRRSSSTPTPAARSSRPARCRTAWTRTSGTDFLGLPGTNGGGRAVRRLAAVRGHQLLADRLRGQRTARPRRRQLAVSVHDQRDLDARPPRHQVRRRHRAAGAEPVRDRSAVGHLHVRRRHDHAPRRRRRRTSSTTTRRSCSACRRPCRAASSRSRTTSRAAATGSSARS